MVFLCINTRGGDKNPHNSEYKDGKSERFFSQRSWVTERQQLVGNPICRHYGRHQQVFQHIHAPQEEQPPSPISPPLILSMKFTDGSHHNRDRSGIMCGTQRYMDPDAASHTTTRMCPAEVARAPDVRVRIA